MADESPTTIHYFLDEAGDTTLFDRRGKKVLVGDSASKHFILGKLSVDDPTALRRDLEALRTSLLGDPYFRDVPSMQPAEKKTALTFHAKDDLPEVRREVFKLLLAHDLRFYAVVRDKLDLVAFVRQQNENDAKYRFRPNELYDTLTRRLFAKLRQFADRVEIQFAKRGTKPRNKALEAALAQAEADFQIAFGFARKTEAVITEVASADEPCLQACDYFLWALQRHYEKAESRFIELVWPKVGEIHDLDARGSSQGVFYTQANPIFKAVSGE